MHCRCSHLEHVQRDGHPILRTVGGPARLGFALWGLLARVRGKAPVINARAETVPFKLAFRDAFASRRCVVPADGFFEWKTGPDGRQPLWFHRPDGKLLLLAGLRRRVGARIAELRGSRGWTQEQFAERLEVGGIRFHGLRAREVWALNRFFPG